MNNETRRVSRRARVAVVVGAVLAVILLATGPRGFEVVADEASHLSYHAWLWYGVNVSHDPEALMVQEISSYPVGTGDSLTVTTDGGTVITAPVGPAYGFRGGQ